MMFKNILITGGSGSFGRACTWHLLRNNKAQRICILSRGEHTQAAMRDEFQNDERIRWFIGDVRDRTRLTRAMEGIDLVIHAAALKRIEVAEYCPIEAVKTNVVGAMNIIEAAQDADVARVVALSTDKACSPINAYGASKLLMEKMMLAANNTVGEYGPIFAVTRYGNVAGSNGSVIPTWREQIAKAGIITVTDPNATRFWMTMSEAVALVLRTAETMLGGEFVVPELPAYRLGDLLEAMGTEGLECRIIGLQPGEKIHESMVEGKTSAQARRMTVDELRQALKYV